MTFDFKAARLTMVESQVRTSDVTDLAIQDAMRIVPRESLCAPHKAALAYADAEIEYAPGLHLLRPRELGKLLQAIQAQAGERALAVAAPYAALVLEAMGLTVDQVDAAAQVKASQAYDVIVCEGSVSTCPQTWLDALAEGGRMGVVVRDGPVGKARLYARSEGRIVSREVFDSTPPYLPGLGPKAEFAF